MNSLQKLNQNLQSSRQSGLNHLSKRYLGKTFRATKYNLRLYRSNLYLNSNSFAKWESVSGPDGYEKTQTDRNPDNFKYKTNLFSHSLYEMRHLYGDVLYQIIHRRHRLNDAFMKYVIPTSTIAFYLLSGNHFFFMVSLTYNNLINTYIYMKILMFITIYLHNLHTFIEWIPLFSYIRNGKSTFKDRRAKTRRSLVI